MLSYAIAFFVALRVIDLFGVPESSRVGVWGDAAVAIFVASALAWFEQRRALKGGVGNEPRLVAGIGAVTWLAASADELVGAEHSSSILIAGVVGLVVCIGPDLIRRKG